MHQYTGNPSKWPYTSIVWSPKTGILMTTAVWSWARCFHAKHRLLYPDSSYPVPLHHPDLQNTTSPPDRFWQCFHCDRSNILCFDFLLENFLLLETNHGNHWKANFFCTVFFACGHFTISKNQVKSVKSTTTFVMRTIYKFSLHHAIFVSWWLRKIHPPSLRRCPCGMDAAGKCNVGEIGGNLWRYGEFKIEKKSKG